MATTKEDIKRWLERGKKRGSTHLIVVVDTFDHEDYPVFIQPEDDVHAKLKAIEGSSMQRAMEVYRLDHNWDNQLNLHRSWSL